MGPRSVTTRHCADRDRPKPPRSAARWARIPAGPTPLPASPARRRHGARVFDAERFVPFRIVDANEFSRSGNRKCAGHLDAAQPAAVRQQERECPQASRARVKSAGVGSAAVFMVAWCGLGRDEYWFLSSSLVHFELCPIQPGVGARALQQLAVRSDFGNAGRARQPPAGRRGGACSGGGRWRWSSGLGSGSPGPTGFPARSRYRPSRWPRRGSECAGSISSARAMLIRCRSPPERNWPARPPANRSRRAGGE